MPSATDLTRLLAATKAGGSDAWSAWRASAGEHLDLRGAPLRLTVLNRFDLRGADLRGADLLGAKLCSARLDGADLRGASLHKAQLYDACLRGARLDDADLTHGYLAGADLGEAQLDAARLERAAYDERTRWPRDWSPQGRGLRRLVSVRYEGGQRGWRVAQERT